MASPTDVSPPADDPGITTEAPTNARLGASRLNQALAWVGIVAGGLFVIAAIFFSGYFLGWSTNGQRDGQMAPMACCSHMKEGNQAAPGAMMPGKPMGPGAMMGPGGPMGQATQSPATTSTPRP